MKSTVQGRRGTLKPRGSGTEAAQRFVNGGALRSRVSTIEEAAISILSRNKALLAPAVIFALTLLLELALVERKYGVFGGGFGASHVVEGPADMALVLGGVALAQALLIGALFLLIRRLHGKRRDTPLFLLNFLFFTAAVGVALLAVKYEVLSYFSDAIGFQLIRNLGGGSLFDAFLFVLDEAGLLLLAAGGAAASYAICWWLVRRFRGQLAVPEGFCWKRLLWLALPLPLLALAANREPDARYALARFNAFAIANLVFHQLTDFDRDGYSWFSAQVDAHPFDASRHPFALDIPGNGIDEDGLAGDFVFDGAMPAEAPVTLPPEPKHLVLIVLESVRGDAIGRAVDGVPVTPTLNVLAREGTLAREAYSHVGFTTASLKSLFSGRLDPAPGDPSLFRDLKRNGYRIGVFSGQPESFGDISEVVGMQESADIFVDAETLKDERASAFAAKGSLLVDGRKLLREIDRSFGRPEQWTRPTFLYVNFQEAHFPYHHPEMKRLLPGEPIARSDIAAENREHVARTYWNAVAYSDWLVGQLIARLKAMGVYEDSLIVVTADHGESLFDDNFLGHGHVINRQQTHIPLVLSDRLSLTEPIGLAGYRPLLLKALGAAQPASPRRPVFQHIGPLDRPAAIGIVEAGGVWTTMTLETEEVWFSDSGRRRRYDDLEGGDKARADRLANEWARQRWLAHLARRQIAVRP